MLVYFDKGLIAMELRSEKLSALRTQLPVSSKNLMRRSCTSTSELLSGTTYRLGSGQKLAPLFDDRNRSLQAHSYLYLIL